MGSPVFDFTGIENSQQVIEETWGDLKKSLVNHEFLYNEINKAKESTFLSVLDDLLDNTHEYFEKELRDVFTPNSRIVRAAKIVPGDPEPTFERFIPNSIYINEDNRFSPKKIEWLYLASSHHPEDLELSEMCALAECRAKSGNRFGICDFLLNEDYSADKVIDLTLSGEREFDSLNKELESETQRIAKAQANRAIQNLLRGEDFVIDHSEIEHIFKKWMTMTYCKLLNEQIFIPIDGSSKADKYLPFQCMAQYFKSRGYSGIIYKSTVNLTGRNIVLFNKNIAYPFGNIRIRNV